MNVPKAIESGIEFGLGQPLTISGYLTVCENFSYLSTDRTSADAGNSKAVLITDKSLNRRLLEAGAAVRVGTMVMFCGNANVSGMVSATGLGLFPIAFCQINAVEFSDDENSIHLSFGSDR